MEAKPRLLAAIQERFALGADTYHGPAHWGRVAFHARALALAEGVSPEVPRLFAWLHDSCREDEGEDPQHGPRAAEFAGRLHRQGLLPIGHEELALLQSAIEKHSEGHTRGHLVERVCWDADRLDLGRVGIIPHIRHLCTPSACDPVRMEQALAWSRGGPRPNAPSLPVLSRPRWR